MLVMNNDIPFDVTRFGHGDIVARKRSVLVLPHSTPLPTLEDMSGTGSLREKYSGNCPTQGYLYPLMRKRKYNVDATSTLLEPGKYGTVLTDD